jgi:hypothetical protein
MFAFFPVLASLGLFVCSWTSAVHLFINLGHLLDWMHGNEHHLQLVFPLSQQIIFSSVLIWQVQLLKYFVMLLDE